MQRPIYEYVTNLVMSLPIRRGPGVRGCAEKSLAQPGRKQATATNLGFIQHTLHEAQCTSSPVAQTFASHSKKCIILSFQPGLRGSSDLRVGRKMATFQLFFSVQPTGGGTTGPDPENRVGDQDIGSPGRPVSSGLQVTGEPGHCRARIRPLSDLPTAFFL